MDVSPMIQMIFKDVSQNGGGEPPGHDYLHAENDDFCHQNVGAFHGESLKDFCSRSPSQNISKCRDSNFLSVHPTVVAPSPDFLLGLLNLLGSW